MIGQILEHDERVHISSWEEAQIFFDFYKDICNASHSTVNLLNWRQYPYFELRFDEYSYDIVGWSSETGRTYEFKKWKSLVEFYEDEKTNSEVVLENCELI